VTGKKYQGNIDEALGLKPIAAKSQQGSLAVSCTLPSLTDDSTYLVVDRVMCRLIAHQQNIIIIITLTNAAAILDLFPWVILPFFLFDEGLGPMQLRVCGTQAHMNRPTTPRF
jgi:hypothetical protein